MTTTPMPLPKIGDKIRVTDTYPGGTVLTTEFVVVESGMDGYHYGNDGVGAYLDPSFPVTYKRTWEILESAPIPEPTGLGAIVRFTRTFGMKATVTLLRDGVDTNWREIAINGEPFRGTARWNWADVLYHTNDVEVISPGVDLDSHLPSV